MNETGLETLVLVPVSGAPEDVGMDEVYVRPARHDDADAIADVYLASFTATYRFPLAHSDQQVTLNHRGRPWRWTAVLPRTTKAPTVGWGLDRLAGQRMQDVEVVALLAMVGEEVLPARRAIPHGTSGTAGAPPTKWRPRASRVSSPGMTWH